MYIGVGVSVGVVVLLAAGLILISVTVCLRRRSKKKQKLITSSNVAYHSTSGQLSVTNETSAGEYDYVSTYRACPPHPDHTLNAIGKPVYGGRLEEIVVEDNEAYIATEIATVNGGGEEEEYECTYYL